MEECSKEKITNKCKQKCKKDSCKKFKKDKTCKKEGNMFCLKTCCEASGGGKGNDGNEKSP